MKYYARNTGHSFGQVVRKNPDDGSVSVVISMVSGAAMAVDIADELQKAYEIGVGRASGKIREDLESEGYE